MSKTSLPELRLSATKRLRPASLAMSPGSHKGDPTDPSMHSQQNKRRATIIG